MLQEEIDAAQRKREKKAKVCNIDIVNIVLIRNIRNASTTKCTSQYNLNYNYQTFVSGLNFSPQIFSFMHTTYVHTCMLLCNLLIVCSRELI